MPVLQRNSFFAHPENLLLSGVCDPDLERRRITARIILEARQRKLTQGSRKFALPNISPNADYM
ncbi:hypothetical protein Ciccas_012823 [Cichlidogyrus casuarinus]|uniref:Uncharacterized protein n=1 Tax=Cichlidogyrus casuarinus TaxID=1844966 RepID=A0ABD2PMB1_9PLAT